MYRVNEVKVSIVEAKENKLKDALGRHLDLSSEEIKDYRIVKCALDARKKSNIHYKYNFDVEFVKRIEKKVVEKFNLQEVKTEIRETPQVRQNKAVVVVGCGPAGLFAAYELVKANVKVILLERGENIDDRVKTVEKLLSSGKLNEESNIQFGEGGAGTFSDGKLNTGINSPVVNDVLRTFNECGADEGVIYESKPHIGTDKLRGVVKNLRNKIILNGGEVRFNARFIDFEVLENKINVIFIEEGKEKSFVVDDLVLALGYSARDTLKHLHNKGIEFKQKAFSVGYRIEHLQEDINKAQYGEDYNELLPPADYKLFTHLANGRTVYTFCMCPGGEVVPAFSKNGEIVTNGMSYQARSGRNANSALLVSVGENDYKSDHPLAGMVYQENLEKQAYMKGNGKFIVSKVKDFLNNKPTTALGKVIPTIKPSYILGNVGELLPKELSDSLKEGLYLLGKKLKGFDSEDAILTGIETRSSAPFMIVRNQDLSTNIEHIYAIGEGAGMAGGIVSSAVDGIKIARKIIENYI